MWGMKDGMDDLRNSLHIVEARLFYFDLPALSSACLHITLSPSYHHL